MKEKVPFLKKLIIEESDNWILWLPVIFSIGIIFQVNFPYYSIITYIIFSIVSLILLFLFRKNSFIFTIFISISIFIFGFFRMGQYIKNIDSPKIITRTGEVYVDGIIDEVKTLKKNGVYLTRIVVKVDSIKKVHVDEKYIKRNLSYSKYLVDNNKLDFPFGDLKNYSYFDLNGEMKNLPENVRITLLEYNDKIESGDRVKVKVRLVPLSEPVFPTSFDFRVPAYFSQIAANGYDGVILDHKKREMNNLEQKLFNFRIAFAKHVFEVANEAPAAGIIGATLVDIRDYMDKDMDNNIKNAGLYHVISISGFHMFLIMGVLFIIIRFLLSRSEYLIIHYNIKKITAVICIFVGFLYMCITGFPVAANRSYAMTCFFLISILLDKDPLSLRSLSFIALAILVYNPSLLLNISFQLSFFAVLGLISGFNLLTSWHFPSFTKNPYLKPFVYILNLMASSLISEICVTPLVIYHFNNYPLYGMLANLFGLPILSFFVMPLNLIILLLYPLSSFGIDKIPVYLSVKGLDLFLMVAEKASNMPNSVITFATPSNIVMFFILFGSLWFWLWSKKLRYFGIILFTTGIILNIYKDIPTIVVDHKDKIFSIADKDGKVYFSDKPFEYKKTIWMQRLGESKFRTLNEYPYLEKDFYEYNQNKNPLIRYTNSWKKKDWTLNCNKNYCLLKKKYKNIYIVKNNKILDQIDGHDIYIILLNDNTKDNMEIFYF